MRGQVLVLGAIVACGRIGFDPSAGGQPPGAGPVLYTSGSRLRAIRYTSGEGADLFFAWHDTQLGVDCGFLPASDGEQRCLPISAQYGQYFADAACTMPLAVEGAQQASCGTPPPYALHYFDGAGTVLALGAEWMQPVYQITLSMGCTAATTLTNGTRMFQVGAEVPPSMFAHASESITPAGRLSYIELEGDDGSRQRSRELVDSQNQGRCAWFEIEPHHAWCLPPLTTIGIADGFSDAACTRPATVPASFTSFAVPIYSISVSLCGVGAGLKSLGTPATTFYDKTCVRRQLPLDLHAFEIGGPLALDAYAQATLEPDPGEVTRLRHYWYVTDSGVYSPVITALWDAMRSTRCTQFVDRVTNHTVCAPVFGLSGLTTLYSDSQCATVLGTASPSCVDPWALAVGNGTQTCAGEQYDFYPFDGPVTGSAWYRDATLGCVSLASSGYTAMLQSQTPLDSSALVPLARSIE